MVIAAWGSVDPWQGKKALQEVERCAKKLKLLGIKFHHCGQAFSVADRKIAYPIWDLCQSLGMPVKFHAGFTGLASGSPGGMGLKLEYIMNIIPDFDNVAADFPKLKIIMLHHAEGRDEDAVLLGEDFERVGINLKEWKQNLEEV